MAIAYSTNAGQSWQRQSLSGSNRGFVRSLAIPYEVGQVSIYAGGEILGQGAVFRSTDRGQSWTACPTAPAETVFALAVDPMHHGAWVYAATPAGLYRTTDYGSSWTNLDGSTGLRAVVLMTEEDIFVGGANGVFGSDDGGQSWSEMNEGLEHRNVTSLALGAYLLGSPLFAGTSDGGTYRILLTQGQAEPRSVPEPKWRPRIPNPVRGEMVLAGCSALGPELRVRVWAVDGRLVYRATRELAGGRMRLDVSGLAAGVYRLEVAGRSGVENARFTLIR